VHAARSARKHFRQWKTSINFNSAAVFEKGFSPRVTISHLITFFFYCSSHHHHAINRPSPQSPQYLGIDGSNDQTSPRNLSEVTYSSCKTRKVHYAQHSEPLKSQDGGEDVIQDAFSNGRANHPTSDSSLDSHEQPHYAFTKTFKLRRQPNSITALSSPSPGYPCSFHGLLVSSLHQTCEIKAC
jgi:hypothetical protein